MNPTSKINGSKRRAKKNWFPTKFCRICSVHFNEGSFKETNKFRRLTTKAIPTIDVLKISNNDEVSVLTFGLIMAPFSQTSIATTEQEKKGHQMRNYRLVKFKARPRFFLEWQRTIINLY